MATKVFISWSGEHSRQVGEIISDWLPSVLQTVKPFFSPDIEKGASWLTEIQSHLSGCLTGIICVTAENVTAPWLLFEAGALSNTLGKSHVCTFCHGISPSNISQPLGSFQATLVNEADVKKLIVTINNQCGTDQLDANQLNKAFDKWWPELEKRMSAITISHKDEIKKERPERELIEEILSILRSNERNFIMPKITWDSSDALNPYRQHKHSSVSASPDILNILDTKSKRWEQAEYMPKVINDLRAKGFEKEVVISTLLALGYDPTVVAHFAALEFAQNLIDKKSDEEK